MSYSFWRPPTLVPWGACPLPPSYATESRPIVLKVDSLVVPPQTSFLTSLEFDSINNMLQSDNKQRIVLVLWHGGKSSKYVLYKQKSESSEIAIHLVVVPANN